MSFSIFLLLLYYDDDGDDDDTSPDNSPDEASPGGLARPLESIGRDSSRK